MECYRHPSFEPVATCAVCDRPTCEECREEIAGHALCLPCVAAAQARLSEGPGVSAPVIETMAQASQAPASATEETRELVPAVVLKPASDPPAGSSEKPLRPGIARRLVRGLLWGAVYGQWWTLFTILSPFLWGHGSFDLGVTLFYFIVYGFFGSLTGLIIGACNASMGTGVAIGVGVGLVLCGLEAVLSHDSSALINVIFYFFTGRFVGAGATWRVQQPLRRRLVLDGD